MAVVLESEFYVAKVITDLESKGVYVGYLIKKWSYWKNELLADLLILNFNIRRPVALKLLRQ